MTDSPRDVNAGDDRDMEPDRGRSSGLAPWQKVVVVIGLLVVLVVIALLVGGGHTSPVQHGMRLT